MLQNSQLFGISETCSWSVLYRRALWLQGSTFCLVPIRRSHAETAANWTCSASWWKGWLRWLTSWIFLHFCHVNFHPFSFLLHSPCFHMLLTCFVFFPCRFVNFSIFFADQILLSRQFRGRGSPERALHLVDLDPHLLRCASHTWLVLLGSLAGRNGCTVEIFLRWALMWCAVAHTSFHTTGNSL